jgi:hypothetical protein
MWSPQETGSLRATAAEEFGVDRPDKHTVRSGTIESAKEDPVEIRAER